MSKFNESAATKTVLTTTKESIPAYPMKEKEKLLTQVLTTFFNEAKFYGDNSTELIETVRSIIKYDPKFIANLALFARNEMHLRSVSHVLIAELANNINGKKLTRQAINKVVERVDDTTEILSYYIQTFGKPIPNSLKKGLADVFRGFNEYELAKYNRDKKIKLRDILCIAHPKPINKEQADLWKNLLENNLKTPITWETELSAKGNKKEVWEKLIDENKLGYMAMLRNLRNIINADVSNIDKVYEYLSNEERVLKNKQLPFRYYSAYRVLEQEDLCTSKIFDVLEKAIKISTQNIEKLSGKTFISADVSGSMNSTNISNKSDVHCSDIAVLMMAIANYICDESITSSFDTKFYKVSMPTTNGIISNAKNVRINGGGTDITLPIQYLLRNKIFVDRIILLSDNQINYGWDRVNNRGFTSQTKTACQKYIDLYRKEINPNVWVHAIDLQGYGTQQFKDNKTNIMAGWSERIFEFIDLTEKGIDTLIKKVDTYYFK
jgi:hypothetical protein